MTIKERTSLLISLKSDIEDDFRCDDSMEDDEPGICVTIGADSVRGPWSYQTGDNSYTGGAYGFKHWAIVYLYRDSNCRNLAKDAIEEIGESVYQHTA